ncbi:hypothetical protein Tco_0277014 [Tanacetum coccineum]
MEANKGANWYSQTYANFVALISSLRFSVLVNKSTVPDSYYDDLTFAVQDRVTPATKQIDHDLPRTSKLMVQS